MGKYRLDQNKTPLFDALVNYALNENVTSFDVPGHKRGKGISNKFTNVVGETIFKLDTNSMKELDLLSNPQSVIKEAEELAADFFSAENAFFLVNGSTSGVQNMILSVCGDNDKIIMPRNVHKSAINALVLSGAKAVFVKPLIDKKLGIAMGVSFEEIKKTIDENLDAKALLLVSPTYFGVTSNMKDIVEYAHSKGIAVLVDESHGSHFGVFEGVSENAMSFGADISTISLHKTGGSLTQSSIMLHRGDLIDKNKIRQIVNLSQTSSASYLLLSSMDVARYELYKNTKNKFNNIVNLSKKLLEDLKELKGIDVLDNSFENGDSIFETDPTKVVVDVSGLGMTGFRAYDILRNKYNIQMELGETNVVLAIVSVGDDENTIHNLYNAFKNLSNDYSKNEFSSNIVDIDYKLPEIKVRAREAFFSKKHFVELDESIGCIAGDSIMFYPPGIPLVVPGEVISKEIIDNYKRIISENCIVLGTENINNKTYISVLEGE